MCCSYWTSEMALVKSGAKPSLGNSSGEAISRTKTSAIATSTSACVPGRPTQARARTRLTPPRSAARLPFTAWDRSQALALGGRADDAVVADRAHRARRGRLEPLAEDGLACLEHRVPHRVGVPFAHGKRDHAVVEHVVVGLTRCPKLPGFARSQCVDRELDVVPELRGGLG